MDNFNENKYLKAKKKVDKLKSFYYSLLAYCAVIPLLAYLNFRTTSYPWIIFPAVGWGIGLAGLWFCAQGYNPILGKDWEERKIKEFMDNREF